VVATLGLTACRQDIPTDVVRKTIGPEGGLITSADSVLTIALRPGALEEPTEITIEPSDDPPDVFGPAYRVLPDVTLALPATLTYRHDLPEDPSDVAIGYVDADEFAAGGGRWRPLPVLAIDEEDRLVKGRDDRLSIFYALLSSGGGGVVDDTGTGGGSATGGDATGDAGTATTDPTDPTNPSDPTTTDPTDPTGPGDSGDTTDTGSVADCDMIFRGPYTVTGFGPMLADAEDLSFDGAGAFVGLDGTDLVAVDPTEGSTTIATGVPPLYGIRHLLDGRIVGAAYETSQLITIAPNGTIDILVPDMLSLPNGVYPDRAGIIWFTDFTGNFLARVDDDGLNGTLIRNDAETFQANGIVFDEDRSMLFWATYGPGQVWRMAIDGGNNPVGEPVEVAALAGAMLDGVVLDECGNLYVVDQAGGGPSSLFRLFLDATGNLTEQEVIAGPGDFSANMANAQFAAGAAWAAEGLDTSLFVTGLGGVVERVDVQVHGAPTAAYP
jgi:hypothetical protein